MSYGKYSISFPDIIVKNLVEWKNMFEVRVDGVLVPLETQIEYNQRKTIENMNSVERLR